MQPMPQNLDPKSADQHEMQMISAICKAASDELRIEIIKILQKDSFQVQELSSIFDMAQQNPERRGMGTTCSLLLLVGRRSFIAHVGDSRAYCIRNRVITQMTEDHSLVHEQLKSGLITEEEAKTHQLKNIITRSVGVQEEVEIDTVIWQVEPGDTYLMCSDGLSNMVGDLEMQEIVNQAETEQAAKALVDVANQRGGEDNITLILMHVQDV